MVLLVAALLFLVKQVIGYRVVAFILMVTVSLLAMLFDMLPVLIAAILSALIWNFFFIPPLFTFHIHNTEDVLLFFMYFIIAMVNAVLTAKIKEQDKIVRDKEEKENTIKLYNTLFNSLSHELRTPIATIMGAVDTLQEQKNKLSEANQTILLQAIATAPQRLNRQVENLLNSSRLETGLLQPNLIWCDINEIVFAVIASFEAFQHQYPICFQYNDQLPLVKIDNGLMEQILHNIVFNAIHHTPENTSIIIEVSVQNELCQLVISDTGNGFPEQEIPLAFDKFYRVPNSKIGGTGLGLSIVKGYVHALGGIITLENSIIHGGASFTILLPTETNYLNNLKNE
jgi:two-component system sensor histidine kinase KdpD